MKRRRRAPTDGHQLNLNFPAQQQPEGKRMVGKQPKKRRSWVEANWPEYKQGSRKKTGFTPVERWAFAIRGLPPASKTLLQFLAGEQVRSQRPCLSLPDLARQIEISKNTCRRHLDGLLTSQLVMIRPWLDPLNGALRGYEFRLITDEDARLKAFADGFGVDRSSAFSDLALRGVA